MQSSADIDGNGVIDDVSNSMGPDNLNWQDAIDHCEALDFAGFTDWRLPTNDELKGLVYCSNGVVTPLANKDEGTPWRCGTSGYVRPTIESVFNAKTQDYWTSTPGAQAGYAKKVNFYYGHSEEWGTGIRRRVRCVR